MWCSDSDFLPIKAEIKQLREKHQYNAEIKWGKVTDKNYKFFEDLFDLFWAIPLNFRALIIKKDSINNEKFGQTHDQFYYKMFYFVLRWIIEQKTEDNNDSYKIFMDFKDRAGFMKSQELLKFLRDKFDDHSFEKIKFIVPVDSRQFDLIQITDVFIGAVGYFYHGHQLQPKASHAKVALIEQLIKRFPSGDLFFKSDHGETKFNLFPIELSLI